MTIPDYQSIMLPLLEFTADKKEHSTREAIVHISKLFNLSEQEKKELLPSGRQSIIDNRVGWARTYLKKAGLLESTRKGQFRITDRGLDVLKRNPPKINVKYLEQFPEFIEFRALKKDKKKRYIAETPLESLEYGYQKIRSEWAQDLLKLVKASSADFFEKLVVELLLRMGYGGSRVDAGKAIGKTGDEGIDGIIKEDKLGLDVIYIQAKKWENNVGRPHIQNFAGALQGKKAKKGIFITTSDFSKEAREFVSKIPTNIVLIDGEQLAELMIDHNIGVTTIDTYEIKKIDRDYFSED